MPASYAPRRPAGLSNFPPQSTIEDASESELEQEDSNRSFAAVTPRQPELLSATELATRAGVQPNSRLMARLQSSTAAISTSVWLDYEPPLQHPIEPVRRRGRPQRVPAIDADLLGTPDMKREESAYAASKAQKERRTTRAHVPRIAFTPEVFQSRSGSRRNSLRFDADGLPLPKRKPGRPRKNPLPGNMQAGARTSSLLSSGPMRRGHPVGSARSSASVLGKRRAPTAFNDSESDSSLKKRRRATLASLREVKEVEEGNVPKRRRRRATRAVPVTEADGVDTDGNGKHASGTGREKDNGEDNSVLNNSVPNTNNEKDSEDELALPSKPKLRVLLKLQKRRNIAMAPSGTPDADLVHGASLTFVPTPGSTAHPTPASSTADLGKE